MHICGLHCVKSHGILDLRQTQCIYCEMAQQTQKILSEFFLQVGHIFRREKLGCWNPGEGD